MLHEFIAAYRDLIISRTRERLRSRPFPAASSHELEHGVPLFLTQLTKTLEAERTPPAFSSTAIGMSAARHGRDLLASGFSVAQVVHDYGDICQAITEVAVEHNVPITTQEFHTLNRCLDTAIAEAVTEHARMVAARRADAEVERLGHVAHEVRDMLNTALLAFESLKRGTVAINGSTGGVLGRTLVRLRDFINGTLTDVLTTANHQRRVELSVSQLLTDIGMAASLDADYREIRLNVEAADPALRIFGDPQLLTSAVMNLVNNALKYTPAGGCVTVRTAQEAGRLHIEVEDECGGLPDRKGDPFQPFGERRGIDRTGLGLGLSIARNAIRAHGGDIGVRNLPGSGCIFAIEIPLPSPEGVVVS